jgi:hypothetical protein
MKPVKITLIAAGVTIVGAYAVMLSGIGYAIALQAIHERKKNARR